MQVAQVETILAEDKWLLVKVTTDNGIVGIGEAGLHGVTEAADAPLEPSDDTWWARTRFRLSTISSSCTASLISEEPPWAGP